MTGRATTGEGDEAQSVKSDQSGRAGGVVWRGVGLGVPVAAGKRDRARGADNLDGSVT